MLVYLKSCTFNFLNLYGTDCQNEIQSKTEIETWVTWRTFQRNLKSIRNQPPLPRPIFSVFNYLLMCDIWGEEYYLLQRIWHCVWILCIDCLVLSHEEALGRTGWHWVWSEKTDHILKEFSQQFSSATESAGLASELFGCWCSESLGMDRNSENGFTMNDCVRLQARGKTSVRHFLAAFSYFKLPRINSVQFLTLEHHRFTV